MSNDVICASAAPHPARTGGPKCGQQTINGYCIEGSLSRDGVVVPQSGTSREGGLLHSTSPVTTFAANSGGSRFVLKVVLLKEPLGKVEGRDTVELLKSIEHRHLDPIVDAFIEDGGLRVVVVRRWCPRLGPLQGVGARKLSHDVASKATTNLLSATRHLAQLLGREQGGVCNIKPSNLSFSAEGCLALHDWFLPLLLPSDTRYNDRSDRQGLCQWLNASLLHDHIPMPAARQVSLDSTDTGRRKSLMSLVDARSGTLSCGDSSCDYGDAGDDESSNLPPPTPGEDDIQTLEFRSFVSLLLNTDSDVSGHKWVNLWRPARLLSSTTRKSLLPHEFVTTPLERLRYAMLLLLGVVQKGFQTDRYVCLQKLSGVQEAAEEICSKLGGFHDMDALEAAVQENASMSPPSSLTGSRQRLGFPSGLLTPAWQSDALTPRIESVWYSEGCGGPNQDRVCAVPHLTLFAGGSVEPGISPDFACGVFDGHGGGEASDYCAHQLLLETRASDYYGIDFQRAFEEGFQIVHANFVKRADTLGIDSGTTATIAVIMDMTLHVGSAGDSTAVLCRGGRAKVLTKDHRPNNPDERRDVVQRGGCFVRMMGVDRVDGKLAVTRSIGDPSLSEHLSCRPDYFREPLLPEDEFVIIASDGLWDVMSPDEVVQFITQCKLEVDLQGASITPAFLQRSASVNPVHMSPKITPPAAKNERDGEFPRGTSFSVPMEEVSIIRVEEEDEGLGENDGSIPNEHSVGSSGCASLPTISCTNITAAAAAAAAAARDDRVIFGGGSAESSGNPDSSPVSLPSNGGGSGWPQLQSSSSGLGGGGVPNGVGRSARDRSNVTALEERMVGNLVSPMTYSRRGSEIDDATPSVASSVGSLLRMVAKNRPSQHSDSMTCASDEHYDDYQVVAEALVAEAQERLSGDDCTVCIAFLNRCGGSPGQGFGAATPDAKTQGPTDGVDLSPKPHV